MSAVRATLSAAVVALAAALIASPVGAASGDEGAAPAGPALLAFEAPCALDGPGRMRVREVAVDHRRQQRVTVRATGLPEGRWRGELVADAGGSGSIATFAARSRDGRVRHSERYDGPVGSLDVGAALFAWEDGTLACQVGSDLAGSSAGPARLQVDGAVRLLALVDQGRVSIQADSYRCDAGSRWRGRVTVVLPHRTLRRSLGEATCRDGAFALGRVVPGTRLPERVVAVVRDRDGVARRVSYRIGP